MNENELLVQEYENRLGVRFPEDYRSFLVKQITPELDNEIVFRKPMNGVVDYILTPAQLLENDENNCAGRPWESLLYIGGNIIEKYLYLKVSDAGFGEVHYLGDSREIFKSFSEFLSATDRKEI